MRIVEEVQRLRSDRRARTFAHADERFGRIDEGRGIRGSGLGLAIVRSIARSHGGDVVLHQQNVGSRFTIVLPVEGPQ